MKHKIFPHLRSMHNRNACLLLSNGSMRCPNLLRLSQANRIVVLDQIKELCQGCLRRSTALCYNCNVGPMSKRNQCKTSNRHPYLCTCNDCLQKTSRDIAQYELLMASGGGNLKIGSSQITNLCMSVTDTSCSELQGEPCDQTPIFEELKRCSDEANQIVSSIINVSDDLQSYREQLTNCDVTIPILCQTDQPSFQQVIDSGKVKLKIEQSYYFFIDLISQDGLGVMRSLWDSGAKSSVSCNRYLKDQRYFLNEKLPSQRSIQ